MRLDKVSLNAQNTPESINMQSWVDRWGIVKEAFPTFSFKRHTTIEDLGGSAEQLTNRQLSENDENVKQILKFNTSTLQ